MMSGNIASGNKAAVFTAVAVVAVSSVYLLWRRVKARVMSGAVVRVDSLYIYPVKSCAEQSVDTAIPTLRGFEGDRTLQVVDANGKYCTPRDKDKSKLFHVTVELWGSNKLIFKSPYVEDILEIDLDDNKAASVKVDVLEAPEKLTLIDYGNDVAAWLEKATGIKGCRLTGIGDEYERTSLVNNDQGDAIPTSDGKAPVSLADEAPYLLVNQASLTDLNRRLHARGKPPVDMRRFRPNIVVSGGNLKPWEEDTLKRIKIRNVEFHVWQRCGRCIMTTINRDTLERGPEPLATLSEFRERAHGMRNFGMHLIPVKETILRTTTTDPDDAGDDAPTISVDDEVEILERDEERVKEWERLFG